MPQRVSLLSEGSSGRDTGSGEQELQIGPISERTGFRAGARAMGSLTQQVSP